MTNKASEAWVDQVESTSRSRTAPTSSENIYLNDARPEVLRAKPSFAEIEEKMMKKAIQAWVDQVPEYQVESVASARGDFEEALMKRVFALVERSLLRDGADSVSQWPQIVELLHSAEFDELATRSGIPRYPENDRDDDPALFSEYKMSRDQPGSNNEDMELYRRGMVFRAIPTGPRVDWMAEGEMDEGRLVAEAIMTIAEKFANLVSEEEWAEVEEWRNPNDSVSDGEGETQGEEEQADE